MEQSLASRYQIQGYPTIKIFNPLNDAPTDYQNQRDAKSFCKAAFSVRSNFHVDFPGCEESCLCPSFRQDRDAEAPPAGEAGGIGGAAGAAEGRQSAETSRGEGDHDAVAVHGGLRGGDVHAADRSGHPRLVEERARESDRDGEGGGGRAGVGSVRVWVDRGRLAVRIGAETELGVRVSGGRGGRRERDWAMGRLVGTRVAMRCRRERSRSII